MTFRTDRASPKLLVRLTRDFAGRWVGTTTNTVGPMGSSQCPSTPTRLMFPSPSAVFLPVPAQMLTCVSALRNSVQPRGAPGIWHVADDWSIATVIIVIPIIVSDSVGETEKKKKNNTSPSNERLRTPFPREYQ